MSEKRESLVNMAMVARFAGVSRATVSNVLNYPDRVKPDTRTAVQSAIDRLGFVRNGVARRLAAGQANSIGIIVSGFDHSYSSEIITSAQDVALSEGMHVVITCSNHDASLQDRHLRYFHEEGVASIILVPMPHSDISIRLALSRGTELVLIDYDGTSLSCPSVRIDNVETGRVAARHLLSSGKRKLHFVGPDGDRAVVHDRFVGVVEAAKDNAYISHSIVKGLSPTAAGAGAAEIARMAKAGEIDGVVAATDIIGVEVIHALRAAEISVPNHVSVVGCDSNAFAGNGSIGLTSVDLLSEIVGETAMKLALGKIDIQPNVVLTPRLVARAT
jgi:LacI family transcriptional regulator